MKKIFIVVIIMLLSSSAFAANEVHCGLVTGLSNVYCRVVRASDLTIWDTGITDFNDNPAWSDTDIAMTENTDVKNIYYASMPAASAGRFYFYVYSNATPANTDTPLASWTNDWDGSAFITLASLNTAA